MKQNIKKIINLIIITMLAIVSFVVLKSIPNFLIGKDEVKLIDKIAEYDMLAQTPPGTVFEINHQTLEKVHEQIGEISTGDYYRANISGIDQIYCAQKGKSLKASVGVDYDELVALVRAYPVGKTHDGKDGGHAVPDKMLSSRVWYKESSKRKASPAEAFILTWADGHGWNEWQGIKQEAIWDVGTLSNNSKDPTGSINGINAEKLVIFGNQYEEFENGLNSNNGNIFKQNDTVQDNVKVQAVYSKHEYIVGPFKMQYVDGVHDEGLSFGGISKMYLKGEHTPQIPIKSFIIGNKEITPRYFETINDTDLVALGIQNYPKNGEEFYVKYDSTTDEHVTSLEVEFEWMTAEAELTYYKGYRYYTDIRHDDSERHCHGEHNVGHGPDCDRYCSENHTGNCLGSDCCYTCRIVESKITEAVAGDFQELLSAVGRRIKHKQNISIPIPNTEYPPNDEPKPETPPPEKKNLHLKLAGHVWEEQYAGKETDVNGRKDDGENWKAGIEVILYYSDGTEVQRTVTNINGYYEFLNLNAQRKYYIEFIYDGQIYQATKYMTGENPEALQSNAMEVSNERIGFNNNFAEISSYSGNYTVRRSLYKNVGETNTAYIISKSSSETPYGIKEIYDYVIEQATLTKNYNTAYNNALNEFGNNDSTKSKLQFIEDCRISSYTNVASGTLYPIYNNFIEESVGRTINGVYYWPLYPKHINIDFGLARRETFDLALRKDVEKATIEINGKTHIYTYDTRNNSDEQDNGTWDINVRLSDRYYNSEYSRELFASDYQYKASDYGDINAQNAYGKTKADELNVYVTYKLTVRNQSQSILGEIMEIVDYYDQDYEYVDERSYIEIKYGIRDNDSNASEAKEQKLAMVGTNIPVGASSNSIYSDTTTIDGYNNLYITGLQNKKLSSGQTAYIYLTFKVKKDNINGEDWIRLDEKVDILQSIGVGKENIAEINGFKTYYRKGTSIPNVGEVSDYSKSAGLFDVDSVPGNLNSQDVPKDGSIKYENFEDDTDKAPNIRLILYRENGELVARTVDGIIWEDSRDEINNSQHTAVGNGIKEESEPSINGVTVQLVELMDNGTEFVWKTFSSGQNNYTPIIGEVGNEVAGKVTIPTVQDTAIGKYIFKSYMPGNYIVRFIYGDKEETVLTSDMNINGKTGLNAKSYNGQDYKSTTYQEGIDQNLVSGFRKQGVWRNTSENLEYIWREDSSWKNGVETLGQEKTTVSTFKKDASNNETTNSTINSQNQKGYLYDITASDANQNVSDAKDIASIRSNVNNYSNNNGNGVTNYLAEILRSHDKDYNTMNNRETLLKELMNNTKMTAETGLMIIELEYDTNTTSGQTVGNNTSYQIKNVNLGLEERPKAGLAINKEVTNVKLTLADGSTLFDATQKATNVLWRDHKQYKFDINDNRVQLDPMKNIRDKNSYDVQYGLIQLTMDEELMHGATIKVSYKITVTNEGEVNYKDNLFYYTGTTSSREMNNVVTTQADQVIDYVANNLQFYAVDNKAWSVIPKDELIKGNIEENLVNEKLKNETDKYNTIITINDSSNIKGTKLVPKMYDELASSVSDDLILTQLITSENKTDDLTYRNIVEIVKTSNDVGRRNAYSVVGNQNPTLEPTEVDSDRAEIVKILPPYGNAGIGYIIATIVLLSSAILISGIVLIKKKVLRT